MGRPQRETVIQVETTWVGLVSAACVQCHREWVEERASQEARHVTGELPHLLLCHQVVVNQEGEASGSGQHSDLSNKSGQQDDRELISSTWAPGRTTVQGAHSP